MPPKPSRGVGDKLSYFLLGGLALNFTLAIGTYFTQVPSRARRDSDLADALERARVAREAALSGGERWVAVAINASGACICV